MTFTAITQLPRLRTGWLNFGRPNPGESARTVAALLVARIRQDYESSTTEGTGHAVVAIPRHLTGRHADLRDDVVERVEDLMQRQYPGSDRVKLSVQEGQQLALDVVIDDGVVHYPGAETDIVTERPLYVA